MTCAFCNRQSDFSRNSIAPYLCPDCLALLLAAQPGENTYPWFVSAVRRAIYA